MSAIADMLLLELERNRAAWARDAEELKIVMCYRRAGKNEGTWESFRLKYPELELPTWKELMSDDNSDS